MRFLNRSRGFTLLEVLIAVLVFSLGLLGVAGLMVLSVRANHSAYLRTQASFLAESMADRIRGSVGRTKDYNGDYPTSGAGAGGCKVAPCSPDELVTRDQEVWSKQLTDFLPNSTASINCDGTQLGSGTQVGAAPFNGLCTMIIRWTEADLSRGDSVSSQGEPATQVFAWVFQP
ncbi:type IV pilus modification protein PilV [Dokdonella sp.]|uniref:type IV pilus modification protein PilV n=1 Tax=Dokdonella sp. TaxID=2291710 RepID=UPI001B144950|nr:type IV pilus modification protein PilV [Dokdonella sp.]MBO9662412.1 type IV pilus modification protein PilV [Dokdonella sp.]